MVFCCCFCSFRFFSMMGGGGGSIQIPLLAGHFNGVSPAGCLNAGLVAL